MKRTSKVILWIMWLGLVVWGLTGLFERAAHGHASASYGSYVPWGLGVSAYLYFLGMSAGLFMLASSTYVFGLRTFERLGRICLFGAAVTLVMGLVCVWLDLGQPLRFYKVLTQPNFSSVMAWMAWLYILYFIFLVASLWFEMRCDLDRLAQRGGLLGPAYRVLSLGWRCPTTPERLEACHRQSRFWMRVMGAISLPLVVIVSGGVGALFATLSARPYWNTGLFPILFLVGALVSGTAFVLAAASLLENFPPEQRASTLRKLSRLLLGLILFDLLLEWAEFSTPMWYGIGPEDSLARVILFGQFWWVFWILHVLLGSLIPIVLLLWRPATRWAAGVAGALVVFMFMAVRLNIVIPGQITPALEGLEEAYVDRHLAFDYLPSAFEWSMVAAVVALGVILFYLGNRVLPLRTLQPQ